MFDFLVGWAWTDKTSLGFLNWAPGEPNAAFHPGEVAEENCVEMYLDGRWNDNDCLQKRGFVCRHRQCKDFLFTILLHFCSFHFGFQKLTPSLCETLSDHTTDDGGNPIIPTDGPTHGPTHGPQVNSKCNFIYLFFTF